MVHCERTNQTNMPCHGMPINNGRKKNDGLICRPHIDALAALHEPRHHLGLQQTAKASALRWHAYIWVLCVVGCPWHMARQMPLVMPAILPSHKSCGTTTESPILKPWNRKTDGMPHLRPYKRALPHLEHFALDSRVSRSMPDNTTPVPQSDGSTTLAVQTAQSRPRKKSPREPPRVKISRGAYTAPQALSENGFTRSAPGASRNTLN